MLQRGDQEVELGVGRVQPCPKREYSPVLACTRARGRKVERRPPARRKALGQAGSLPAFNFVLLV